MTLMEKLEADIDDLRAKIKRYEDDPTFDRKDPAYLAWFTRLTGLETERRERAQANALPAPAAVPQGMTLLPVVLETIFVRKYNTLKSNQCC
jgi:hypothetical protein